MRFGLLPREKRNTAFRGHNLYRLCPRNAVFLLQAKIKISTYSVGPHNSLTGLDQKLKTAVTIVGYVYICLRFCSVFYG